MKNTYIEYIKLSKNNISKLCMLFFIIIFMSNGMINYFNNWNIEEVWYMQIFIQGSMEGHITFILIMWFLPIYYLLIINDKTINEFSDKYKYLIFSKENFSVLFKNKLIFSFLFGFIFMFILIIFNSVLCYIIYKNNTFLSYDIDTWDGFLKYKLLNPFITIFFYSMLISVYSGLVSTFNSALCMAIPKRLIVYPIVTIINLLLFTFNFTGLNKIIQPFVEGSLINLMLNVTIVFFIYIFLTLISYEIFKKRSIL